MDLFGPCVPSSVLHSLQQVEFGRLGEDFHLLGVLCQVEVEEFSVRLFLPQLKWNRDYLESLGRFCERLAKVPDVIQDPFTSGRIETV